MPFGRVMSPTESFIHGLDEKVRHLSVLFLHILNVLLVTILLISQLVYVYSFILEIHGKCFFAFENLLSGVEVMIFGGFLFSYYELSVCS